MVIELSMFDNCFIIYLAEDIAIHPIRNVDINNSKALKYNVFVHSTKHRSCLHSISKFIIEALKQRDSLLVAGQLNFPPVHSTSTSFGPIRYHNI